jgi:outer membrane biosynthesis protein TonB
MKKPIIKKSSAKKEVVKEVVKKVVKKAVKQMPIEKPIIKKPIKKPNTKTLSKEVKVITKIVKPVFVEKPVIEINYSWDIENIEIDNLTNVINQITYELIGTLNDESYPVGGTILISKNEGSTNKVETSDYKTLTKQEIIDYIISKVSEKHLDVMKALIIQNFNGSKIIDKNFWKS